MWRDQCGYVSPTYGCDDKTIWSLWSPHAGDHLGRVNLTRLYNNRSI